MKKIAILLVVLLACGCGPKYDRSPTQVVEDYHDKIFRFEFTQAYMLLDARLKSKFDPDNFKSMFGSDEKGHDLEELRNNVKFEYTDEAIHGNRAEVFGKASVVGKDAGNFRMKLALEDNQWKIDSEVIENEDPVNKGFYRDFDLMAATQSYFSSMMSGDAKKMWSMSSERITKSTTLEGFAQMTVMTVSGKTPQDEGFEFELKQSFADEKGNGYSIVKIIQPKSKDMELAEGVGFKLPFILDNDVWKADFSQITEEYRINIQE